jgi:predicted enzyme related to lactoylglutathione lyase
MPSRDAAPLGAPCWIDLFSSDTDKAREFYGAAFGWTAEDSGTEYGGYINFSKDGILVAGMMHNDGSSGSPDGWNTYLAVADAEATVEAAANAGATVYLQPMEVMDLGSMAMIADPGGAAIGIWQPGLHKGFGVLGETGAPAWFELHTRDYDTVLPFYRDVFGWDTHTMSDTPEFRYTTLGDGRDALAGVIDATSFLPAAIPANWAVYIAVADTDATAATITELGGSVPVAPENTPFGRLATVTDPTGASLRVIGPNT